MEIIQKELEFQLDKKPSGYVIRLNDEHGCLLRICKVPYHLVEDANGIKGFIDVEHKEQRDEKLTEDELEATIADVEHILKICTMETEQRERRELAILKLKHVLARKKKE